MKKLKIYAMIPARLGSTRLKMKNLALIDGKPMISYAINAAKDAKCFDKIIVNSEDNIFKKISTRFNVDFYLRPNDLGSSNAKSDSVVENFMNYYSDADIVAWVNPISPFQSGEEISNIVEYFIKNRLDSLITVEEKQVHCNYMNKAINYDINGLFEQTQDLEPIQPFVYSVMMWRKDVFLKEFATNGHSLFCGNFGTYPVSKLSGIIIKDSDDLKIADSIMRVLNSEESNDIIEYDNIVN